MRGRSLVHHYKATHCPGCTLRPLYHKSKNDRVIRANHRLSKLKAKEKKSEVALGRGGDASKLKVSGCWGHLRYTEKQQILKAVSLQRQGYPRSGVWFALECS